MNTNFADAAIGTDPVRGLVARLVVALIAIPSRVASNALVVARHKRKTMLVLAGLLLVAAMGFAGAQTSAPADPAAAAEDANAKNVTPNNYTTQYVAQAVVNAINSGINTKLNQGEINDYGQLLAGTGVAVMLVWLGLKTLAAGRGIGDMFAEWTPVLVAYGVVQIACFVPIAGFGTLAQQIPESINKIGTAMTGQPIGDLYQSLYGGMDTFMKAIYNVMEMKTQASIDSSGFFGAAATSVLTGLMRIVTVIFVVLGMVVYCGVILFAHVAVEIGAKFAPILVPFLIFKPMSGVFMGWVNFMIGASLTKVVAAVMAVLTANIFTELNALSATIAADVAKGATVDAAGADVVLFSFAILMSLLAATLMYQAPGIATGLWSGSAGGAGFGGIGKATGGANFGTAPARAAGGAAASGAGWGAGKVFDRTLGAHFARKQAQKDAQSGNVPMGAQRYRGAAQHRAYQIERTKQAAGSKAQKTDVAI